MGQNKHMRKMGLTLLVGVFGLVLAAGSARADQISFFLTTNETPPGGSIPQANAVEVFVTTNFAGGALCPLGSAGSHCVLVEFEPPSGNVHQPVEINVNGAFDASTPDSGGFAGGFSLCGPGTLHTCVGGGEGAASFGTMNLETAGTSVADVFIYLTAVSGNSWAGPANVLAPDSKGFEALVSNGSDGPQEAGAYTSSSVPEPTSVLLLGSVALLGGHVLRRKLARS